MTNPEKEVKQVLEANIAFHSALADTYNADQPHFKSENINRVEHLLADMAAKTGGGSLLDLGCGTGFIIDIAKKYFQRVVGVDITQAMLNQVDTSDSQVELYLADTGNVPLPDNEFDVCTAYGFLHHLHDLRPTLNEAYRCLRPGGLFFSELDPNYYYWWLMDNLKDRNDLTGIVEREVRSVVSISEDVATNIGLSPEIVSLAEFQKVKKGGFEADKITSLMKEIGFCSINYRYEWFLGQGKVFHQQSVTDAQVIEEFLREALPATRHLFKYISFYAER
ncbi:class I SAM-dependent methyltransferase [Candidatus Parabeggiatoa sp. HSG14]|uniref:class I SAM-dependent methyltransferase n=1 Tax=Candidatus Parabeggiatoa sp. HSG14 TaxID=3055593 RepID=UPI0025A75603|nr:class I SAM-dependent methyltransferase [Thiotrichales bacterium HSG14]